MGTWESNHTLGAASSDVALETLALLPRWKDAFLVFFFTTAFFLDWDGFLTWKGPEEDWELLSDRYAKQPY